MIRLFSVDLLPGGLKFCRDQRGMGQENKAIGRERVWGGAGGPLGPMVFPPQRRYTMGAKIFSWDNLEKEGLVDEGEGKLAPKGWGAGS